MSLLTFFKLPMQFLVSRISRLSLLLLPLCLIMTNADAANLYSKEFRIGYQKGNSLVILKASGALEKVLAPYGVNVK